MNTNNTFTTRRIWSFKSTWRTAAAAAALTITIGLGVLSPLQVFARREAQGATTNVADLTQLEAPSEDPVRPVRPSRGDRGGRGETQQTLPVVRTRLDGRKYSGGDLDSSSPWEKAVTLTVRAKLYFRWSTTEQGVTSAEWQVTDSPGGFSNQQVGTPDTIIAHGQLQPIPASGQARVFDINFMQLLPSSPSNTPRLYYVRVVLQQRGKRLTPSSSVKVSYKKSDAQPALDFDEVTEANIAAFATNSRSSIRSD